MVPDLSRVLTEVRQWHEPLPYEESGSLESWNTAAPTENGAGRSLKRLNTLSFVLLTESRLKESGAHPEDLPTLLPQVGTVRH